ncbi:MAG: hypothetical protein ACYCQI_03565 [Gammaproteobacteria bacterium]
MKTHQNVFSSNALFWFFIFTLIVVEYLYFRSYLVREIIGYYPRHFDQAGYLSLSYPLYEAILNDGILAQFKNGSIGFATTFSFNLQTVFAFILFGVSRFSAFLIGFIYFAVLQLLLVKVAKDLTNKWFFPILLLGLLLSSATIFYWAGGIFDFRIDFMAFCLFGMIITCIIRSDIFINKKWTFFVVILSVYLILLRYITLLYIFGIFLTLLGYLFLLLYFENKKGRTTDEIKIRIKHISISLIAIILFISPFLWSGWDAFYHYYIGNHVLSNEKYLRAAQMGVKNIITNLFFYPKSILRDHIGLLTLGLILLSIIGTYVLYKIKKIPKNIKAQSINLTLFFLLLCILIPIFLLTMDYAKSPVVGNITIIPILWMVVWSIFIIYKNSNNKWLTNFLIIMSVLSLILGVNHYIQFARKHTYTSQKDSLNQINRMYTDIGYYLHLKGKDDAIFSSDRIADFLIPQVLTVIFYEQNGILLRPSGSALGYTNLYETTKEIATKELQNSDVFIVNLGTYPVVPADYPFNTSMNALRAGLRDWAQNKMTKLGDYEIYPYKFRVYVKN